MPQGDVSDRRTMSRWRRPLLAVTLGLTAMLLVACSSDDDDDDSTATSEGSATATETMAAGEASDVDVTLSEFAIELSTSEVPAGAVTFRATNEGTIAHEMVIVRSDEPVDALPLDGATVDEAAVDVIGELEEFPAGETEEGTFDLEPGRYILFCNIAGHYEGGMRTEFTVS
jgi:uncharacterized cupredoxin-like copper-binding protein